MQQNDLSMIFKNASQFEDEISKLNINHFKKQKLLNNYYELLEYTLSTLEHLSYFYDALDLCVPKTELVFVSNVANALKYNADIELENRNLSNMMAFQLKFI